MKDSLSHLPQIKADELELIAFNIRALCDDVQLVILFGSYAREYNITKQQLEQLAPYVKKLHEVTEKVCRATIESFGNEEREKQ